MKNIVIVDPAVLTKSTRLPVKSVKEYFIQVNEMLNSLHAECEFSRQKMNEILLETKGT